MSCAITEHVCPAILDAMFLVWPYAENPLFIEMVDPNLHSLHGIRKLAILFRHMLDVTFEWW